MKRREFLKGIGLTAAAATVAPKLLASPMGLVPAAAPDNFNPDTTEPGELNNMDFGIRDLKAKINRQITVVVVGYGSRGKTYCSYAERFPDLVKVVGVSDINPVRKEACARLFNIPAEHQFGDFHEILSVPKFADAMIICTPDDIHFEPCMKAMDLGYDVLLEKPMAPTEKECRQLLAKSRKTGRILATCHVLRYAPYFIAMREVVKSGAIGDVVSVQHMEPIEYGHMAHSYVRGIWRNSDQSTPIILAKSCHDLDIIRWIVDKPCESIVADGSLYLFKKENAPEGAPMRCTDGCPHEKDCPYSAIKIYKELKHHLYVFDNLDRSDDEQIMERLRTTQYGRCVYHCDNNQPDHYVANMVFAGGITSSFNMEAFTLHGGRRTRIMGTRGMIDGDMESFSVTDFNTQRLKKWNMKVEEIADYKGSGHGGGDHALFRDFVEAVAFQDPSKLSSTVDVSIESHLMGFAAERSRKSGKKEKI